MSESGIGAARQHLEAAMEALGMGQIPDGEAELVRRAVERVRRVRPGVPAHHAMPVIEALRAMGWGPPPVVRTVELADDPRLRARGPLPAIPADGAPLEPREMPPLPVTEDYREQP